MTEEASLPERQKGMPQNHRTVDRVSDILEQVTYNPGMTFSQLTRKVGGAKSSLHGFISGLLARGWLHQSEGRFYLGPTMYSLTMASGHEASRIVTNDDLRALHLATGLPVFLGVRAGESLVYISGAGQDPVVSYEARTNIRRVMLNTAGGLVMLAHEPLDQRTSFLARRPADEAPLIAGFLSQYDAIHSRGYAVNHRASADRFALAACVLSSRGGPIASVTIVGKTADVQPRETELAAILVQHARNWNQRAV